MDPALHAIRRFGLGATPAALRALNDPQMWLRDQLQDRSAGRMDTVDAATPWEIAALLDKERQAKKSDDKMAADAARKEVRQATHREVMLLLHQRVHTPIPFVERLVAFWSNHLCISVAAKRNLGPLAGWYERQAIRPHVLGNFEQMVLASAQHPAMLIYLDNAASIGPNSPGALRAQSRGKERGFNENYARELLELHTLGVEGPYEQQDVEQLALMLTGWSVQGLGKNNRNKRQGEPGFLYRHELHEPGDKTLLGRRYAPAGEAEARHAIHDLCSHPATARFVCTKLARHFVADEPPIAAINTLERVFRESDGDLLEMSRALIELPEAWDTHFRKFRTPQDWLVAILRIAPPEELPKSTGPVLRKLRHPVWAPASPKGYGDTLNEWSDPDSLMNRAELGRKLARDLQRQGWAAEDILTLVPRESRTYLDTVLSDTTLSSRDKLALLVGGPAFQWR